MALTAERNTRWKAGELLVFPVAAQTRIFQGGLVVLDGGYAKPGHEGTGLVAAGMASETVDNRDGSAGAALVTVRPGVHAWRNSSGADAIGQADVGKVCYVVDDETVAKTDGTGTRSAAGTVLAVDAQGVWVRTGI
ncbi:hypothetical protein KBD49_13230 [Myxococcota bacterium]|jgi:pyrimidine deaminase RibD-like protein|nr:hypothetical protein [Myxococcota bacterium]